LCGGAAESNFFSSTGRACRGLMQRALPHTLRTAADLTSAVNHA